MLFCVHQHIRDLSPALAKFFPVKHPLDQDTVHLPGDCSQFIIILNGVESTEFEALLDMIYTP